MPSMAEVKREMVHQGLLLPAGNLQDRPAAVPEAGWDHPALPGSASTTAPAPAHAKCGRSAEIDQQSTAGPTTTVRCFRHLSFCVCTLNYMYRIAGQESRPDTCGLEQRWELTSAAVPCGLRGVAKNSSSMSQSAFSRAVSAAASSLRWQTRPCGVGGNCTDHRDPCHQSPHKRLLIASMRSP